MNIFGQPSLSDVDRLYAENRRLQAALFAAEPVVEAARALVEHFGPFSRAEMSPTGRLLLDVLAARVRAHTDTTTEKG